MDGIREEETAASFAVSLDGVPLRSDGEEEACWREASCGTVSFHDADGARLNTLRLGPEARKETLKAQLAAEVAHQDAARRWSPSPTPRPTTGRFPRSSGPTSGRSTSFTHASISAKCPTVAGDWYERYRVVLRDDDKGVDKVVRAISVPGRRQKRRFSTASSGFSRGTGARYASLKAKGYGSGVVEAANKVLVNQRMKRAGMRWSRRPERPHLEGEVGPLRRGGR